MLDVCWRSDTGRVLSSDFLFLSPALEDLDKTQQNLVTKLLKTGWVTMLTLIRGKSVILFDFLLLYTAFSLNQSIFFHKLSSGGGYSGNQENRYVGFGNTVTPEKKEDDFINNAMSSIYSVRHDILAQLYLCLPDLSSPLTFLCLSFRAGAVSL